MPPTISCPNQRRNAFCIRISLFISLAVGFAFTAQGQPVNNDPDPTRWIRYEQTYYKIPVVQPGIYRITTTDLQHAGVPVNQIDPTMLQLFHRGIEQAIYVAGELDHQFDADDFLEFYGQGNDGVPDSLLYRPVQAQPHRYYSLFSDTTAYFLTWRQDAKPGKRMAMDTDTNAAGLVPEAYYWAEEVRLFTDNYPGWAAGIAPWVEYSYYQAGEGYTGVVQQKDKPFPVVFGLNHTAQTGLASGWPCPRLDVLLVGRGYTNHWVECRVGPTPNAQRQLDTASFAAYNNVSIQRAISWTDVGADGQLVVSTVSRWADGLTDAYSVSFIRLQYPAPFITRSQPLQTFRLVPNAIGRSLITLTDGLPDTRFWDVTDPTAPVLLTATPYSGTTRLIVSNTITSRTLLSANQPRSIPAIRPVTFVDWSIRKPTYLIISHETLMKPVYDSVTHTRVNAVRDYAAYRASVAGGGHDTLVVTQQQLIDQYSYGERHPLAIRRFAAQLLRQSRGSAKKPQYLLLLGRSRSTPGIRRDPNQATLDLVMTAGFPGSDVLFTAGLEDFGLDSQPNDVPAIPTGRINAATPQEVINYLHKVKEYERADAPGLWRKNLLHLSGGETQNERNLFGQLVNAYRDKAVDQSLGARVTTYAKAVDGEVEPVNVVRQVNEGVGLLTFFGHSGLDKTDLNIGFCSNDTLGYRNKGKYPVLLINGCAIGNFFYGRPTLATDWVVSSDRGAIAAIAQSHLGYPDVMHQYSTVFYTLLTDSTQLHKSIGQWQQETIRRVLAQTSDDRDLANCQQMVLQGDPAIRLFPFQTPDYAVTTNGLTLWSANHQPPTTQSDSVRLSVVVENAGQYRNKALSIRIRRLINGLERNAYTFTVPHGVAYRDTLLLSVPNERDTKGHNQFEVTLNPIDSPEAQPETNRTNNKASITLDLPARSPLDRMLTSLTVYPNPFRDQTVFVFHLTGTQPPTTLTITLTDLNGRVVRFLSTSEFTTHTGPNTWVWDGCSDAGERLPAGSYIYTIRLSDDGSVSDSLAGRLSGRLILHR